MKRLNVLLFLFIAFTSQVYAAVVPCELLLARGPRGAYHDRRASVRMLPASARGLELELMGAPTPEERDDIYRKAAPVEGKPPATAFVRAGLEYLMTRDDWSPFQKAVFWEQVAIDIDQLPGIGFGNVFHISTDGSFMFSGTAGEAIVFRPDGKIFRGSLIFLKSDEVWKANYTGLKLLNP